MKFVILFLNFLLIPQALMAESSTSQVLIISDYLKLSPNSGTHKVSGYVAKHSVCPECPTGAHCKPCMPDSILLSENEEKLSTYPTKGNYLVIFTKNPKQLNLKQKYLITFKVLPSVSSNYGKHDMEMISFEEADSAKNN